MADHLTRLLHSFQPQRTKVSLDMVGDLDFLGESGPIGVVLLHSQHSLLLAAGGTAKLAASKERAQLTALQRDS